MFVFFSLLLIHHLNLPVFQGEELKGVVTHSSGVSKMGKNHRTKSKKMSSDNFH